MLKLIKEYEGKWFVWNTKTNKCADIIRINGYNPFGKSNPQYRVDVNGKTVESLIDSFQKARGIASKNVQK